MTPRMYPRALTGQNSIHKDPWKATTDPRVMVPPMTSRPPYQRTSTVPRLAKKSMPGWKKELILAVLKTRAQRFSFST